MGQLLSITIEDRAIKLLVTNNRRIKTAVKLPLKPGLVKDGLVLDKAMVSDEIKQLLRTEKITLKKTITSVSGIHSIYRLIRLPRLSNEILTEAVKREAEKIIPMPLEELYLSWQVIPTSDKEVLVCLLSLPKNTVDSVVDSLRQAGLNPYLMDVRPLASARVANEPQAIVINVETTNFDITITINGIPELVRSLPFSRDNLLPKDKAAEIEDELSRTINFYNASHETEPISTNIPLVLGGDIEVSRLLSQALPYPVKPLTVPFSYPDNFNVNDFITNIGLILKKTKTYPSPLRLNWNTLPQVYLPKPIPIFSIFSWMLVLAAMGFLTWFGISTYQAITETSALKKELIQVQSAIKTRGFDPKEISQLETKLAEITTSQNKIKTTLTNLEQQRSKVSNDLTKVISLLPSNITLTNINYGSVLSVKGIAPEENTILNYAKSLKEKGFSQVLVTFDTKAHQEVDFTLILK